MKKTEIIICCIILLLLAFLFGCRLVQMSPEYAKELESSAVRVEVLNKRCQAGDDLACRQGLRVASETLNLLVDAMYGVEPNDVD